MMELPNHIVPWDTVKELLKQAKRDAWEEGIHAAATELDGPEYWLPPDMHNPYGEDK